MINESFIKAYADYFRIERGPSIGFGLWLVGEDWLDEVGQAKMQRPACQADPTQCRRGLLRQDFGESWAVAKSASVMGIMEQRQGNTLLLLGASILFALLVAVPVGLFFALRPASRTSFALFNFTDVSTRKPSWIYPWDANGTNSRRFRRAL